MQETARCNLQVAVTHHGDVLEAQPEPVATVPPSVCVFVCTCTCVYTLASCLSGRAAPLVAATQKSPVWGLLCSTEGIPRSSGAERPGALIPPQQAAAQNRAAAPSPPPALSHAGCGIAADGAADAAEGSRWSQPTPVPPREPRPTAGQRS